MLLDGTQDVENLRQKKKASSEMIQAKSSKLLQADGYLYTWKCFYFRNMIYFLKERSPFCIKNEN